MRSPGALPRNVVLAVLFSSFLALVSGAVQGVDGRERSARVAGPPTPRDTSPIEPSIASTVARGARARRGRGGDERIHELSHAAGTHDFGRPWARRRGRQARTRARALADRVNRFKV
jgi:hypothetical protein